MPLRFDDQECATLKQAIGYYLPQLRMARAGSEAREAQHALSILETALEAIFRRLEEASSSAEVHAP